MRQFEQIINAIKNNGGFATLGWLNRNTDVSHWKTKTPFASIRRIVQDKRFFFKIKPGLWGLKEYKKEVLKKFSNSEKSDSLFNHS